MDRQSMLATICEQYADMRSERPCVGNIKCTWKPDFKYQKDMMTGTKWTEEENAKVVANFPQKSDKEIGRIVFRTAGSVREQRRKLNLKRKRVWM